MERDLFSSTEENHRINKVELPLSILVVDDDKDFAESLKEILESSDYRIFLAFSRDMALDICARELIHIALLDIRLGTANGLDLIRDISLIRRDTSIIMMTAFAEIDSVIKALQGGAFDFIRKPIYPVQLLHTVSRAAEMIRLQQAKQEAEVALRRSEERYLLAIEGVNDGVWDWNILEDRVYFSPRFLEIASRSDSQKKPYISRAEYMSWINKDDRGLVESNLGAYLSNTKPNYACEYRLLSHDGHDIWVLDRGMAVRNEQGKPERMVGSLSDISQRKKLESQLIQTQKMDAVGSLAGGVAHDFNNLLTGIIGYASLLKIDLKDDDKLFRKAEIIFKTAERAKELTSKLLNFSRQGSRRNETFDINKLIEEVVALVARTFDKNINIILSLCAEQCCVRGDPGQLHQVLLNLAINARDAMSIAKSPTLEISTTVVRPTTAAEVGVAELEPCPYVQISVSDSGIGMSPAIQNRIFEPFFTTKGNTGGLGMGLAVVYGIVREHGGGLEVSSKENIGTTFRVFLPLVEPLGSMQGVSNSEDVIKGEVGLVLVVDDEEILRQVGSQMLARMGFETHCCSSGEDAVRFFRENVDRVRLVVLDLVMPGMNGIECLAELRRLKPEIPVVLSSGLGLSKELRLMVQRGDVVFLPKPFSLSQMSDSIHSAVTRNSPGG